MGFDHEHFDWSGTPLGPRAHWSPALQTAYDIVMSSGFAMCAMWGPARTLIYNAAYAPMLGMRHPHALGQPIDQVWSDVWPDIEPMVHRALAGESVQSTNLRLVTTRHGKSEEAFWTFSYSPLRDGGRVMGFLNVTYETTHHVLAEQRAHYYAERMQLALAAGAIMGTWMWDLVSDRFVVDDAFAECFGLNPALGLHDLSLAQVLATVHPDDKLGLNQAIDDAIERGGSYSHQYRVKRTDGNYYWVEANGRVEVDESGRALRFPGVLVDVQGSRAIRAERDVALARLRALNAELERKVTAQSLARGRTWQLSSDILAVVNANGLFEAHNPAWERVLGWSEEDITQSTLFDLLHPDDEHAMRQAWRALLNRETATLKVENRVRHKRDGWRWLSWSTVIDERRIYCSARDITTERKRQMALIERTAERDRLWSTTNDLMGTAKVDGFLKAINPAWTTLLGWSEQELLNQRFSARIVAEDMTATVAVLRRLQAKEEVTGFVNRLICRDGSRKSIMWTAKPDAGTDQFFLVGRDVTDQRLAEESLRQSQKMEAVGRLTGGLAHDFNNLLAGISGALELMELRLASGRTDDIDRYMGTARDAAQRAAVLTHRLLAFSRRQTLAPRACDVDALIGTLVELIQRTVGPAIEVEHVSQAGVWTVLVDVSQFENALLNLCINARDAMPDGGRIRIQTRNERINAERSKQLEIAAGEYLTISVADNGEGMSAEVLAQAFEPFFTTKPLGQGTGLGLSMIYGFAKQSGGQMRMHSTVGVGTDVRLYLPRFAGQPDREAAGVEPVQLDHAQTEQTVLVLDDEPSVRMLVVDVLEELGYATLEAADAPSGLSILESGARIDLLISDVGLPGGMNGRQIADQALETRPDLKILFITGYAETMLVRDEDLDDQITVLTKPFSIGALARAVRSLTV